jgi:hypothetical protein
MCPILFTGEYIVGIREVSSFDAADWKTAVVAPTGFNKRSLIKAPNP